MTDFERGQIQKALSFVEEARDLLALALQEGSIEDSASPEFKAKYSLSAALMAIEDIYRERRKKDQLREF